MQKPISLFVAAIVLLGAAQSARAEVMCEFLQPIGGDGTIRIVSKSAGRVKLLGRADWNTDFIVNKSYESYKLFSTANSSDPGSDTQSVVS